MSVVGVGEAAESDGSDESDVADAAGAEAGSDGEDEAGREGRADGDGSAPSPTEDLLYGVIRRLWPLHRTIVRAVERELTGTGMTAGEHALLDALRAEGPRTVPQLARTLGLDRQPVQRWVNHATELGLVVTAPNPAHRRSSLIRLTHEGSAVMAGIQESEAAELRHRLADLSTGEVHTALRVLDRLGEEFRHLANDSRVQPKEPDSTNTPHGPYRSHISHSPAKPDEPDEPDAAPAPPHPRHHPDRIGRPDPSREGRHGE